MKLYAAQPNVNGISNAISSLKWILYTNSAYLPRYYFSCFSWYTSGILFIFRIKRFIEHTSCSNGIYAKADIAKLLMKKQTNCFSWVWTEMQTSLLGKHRFNAIFDIFQLACNGSTHFNLVCDWFVLFLRPQHEQNECVCLLSAIDYISYIIVPFVLLAIYIKFTGVLSGVCMRHSIPQCGRKGRCDPF